MKRILFALFVLSCFVQQTLAYTYHKTTDGPLSVEIVKPGAVMQKLDTPLELTTVLKNSSDVPLDLTLTYSTIETIEFDGAVGNKKRLIKKAEVPAKGNAEVKIGVIGRSGTLSVHYPVHLTVKWSGGETKVVLPFESTITPNPNWPTPNPMLGKTVGSAMDLPLTYVHANNGLSLYDFTTYRAFWTLDKEKAKENFEPVGWTGSSEISRASFGKQSMTRSGVARQSLNMHPSYRGGPGNVGIEYRIQLPETTPITFTCYGAMRDVDLKVDNPTDGVTFRITANGKTVMEKHVASTDWTPLEADLSDFAGKEIVLRLIADPGPKRDTTCDSCYWGDPMIFAGQKPVFADPVALKKQQEELHAKCVETMKTGGRSKDNACWPFLLGGGLRAAVAVGDNGFLDGKIAVGAAEKFVVYDGIRVKVKDQPVGGWPTTVSVGACTLVGTPFKNSEYMLWKQKITIDGEEAEMTYQIAVNGPALAFSIECSKPEWITSIQMGPTDAMADAVYYGHGYCIKGPKKFTVGADGHRLSTSHIGLEYPSGIAVLHASTMMPATLVVDNEKNIATMDIRPGTTLTLLPGEKGAFDCAIRYRSINPKKAADGVKTKAGRFCFDIWGGKYARHLEILENAVKYGLTDSLFIVHSWQHYGYDNRLPDIWPPATGPGTLEEMQAALKLCEENGILYGLHDNYIDIYPDADGYNMDLVSFERHGQPRKAWFNRGIQARSYQFRPDTFLPFLNRNFDMMLPHLPQSCYFVDVFSSMGFVDYYDRQGKLHTRAETEKYWGECFDVIRSRLTSVSRERQKTLSPEQKKNFHAVTISESGHDGLIGHLDGADCQFGRLDTKPNDFVSVVPCDDWERVPWFDLVNHTTFSLHGAGYSNRYEGGLGRLLHGIESDDYITSEIMTGHPAMVDNGCALRGAVRKYWLMQPTLRELADCEVASVEFVDGDIHRMKIVWRSPDGKRETTVYVNRSRNDWKISVTLPAGGLPKEVRQPTVFEQALPPFGFFACGPAGFAGIYRDPNGEVVESAQRDYQIYVNGRQRTVESLQAVKPGLKPDSFKHHGDNRFSCEVLWEAKTGTRMDYSVFVHVVPEDWKKTGNDEGIKAVWGVEKKTPTSEWSGPVVTPMNISVNNDLPAGKYRLLVGMWSPSDGHRALLVGKAFDNGRYSIGLLNVVRGDDGKIASLSIEEDATTKDDDDYLRDRLVPPKKPGGFGPVETKGAFLIDLKKMTVTPLPDEPDTEIKVLFPKKVRKVVAVDADGKAIRDVPSTDEAGGIVFTTKKGEFCYVIE